MRLKSAPRSALPYQTVTNIGIGRRQKKERDTFDVSRCVSQSTRHMHSPRF